MTPEEIARKAIADYINDDATNDYLGDFFEMDPDVDPEVWEQLNAEVWESVRCQKLHLTQLVDEGD